MARHRETGDRQGPRAGEKKPAPVAVENGLRFELFHMWPRQLQAFAPGEATVRTDSGTISACACGPDDAQATWTGRTVIRGSEGIFMGSLKESNGLDRASRPFQDGDEPWNRTMRCGATPVLQIRRPD